MHGIHQSRGRIVFEVACAMALAASFAVAWTQTGASALLAAASVAVLYSVVRTFDLRHVARAVVPVVAEQPDLPVETAGIEAAPAEPRAAAKPKRRSRKKPAGPEPAPVLEVVETPVLDLEPEAPAIVELVAGVPEVVEFEDEHHPPPVPLFEPEPFVRQQRTVFGRKSG
jgi:hypothetical protein